MNKISILFIVFSFFAYSQKSNIFENKNLKISSQKNIDCEKIWITLTEFDNKDSNFYNLFQDNNFSDEKYFNFPTKSGFYNLNIYYDLKLQYKEIIYYNKNPENEKLKFKFFKKRNKLHCIINSNEYSDLNKEVILYKINFKKVKENINNIKIRK